MPVAAMSDLADIVRIEVSYHGRPVGTLARPSRLGSTYFEYTRDWLHDGFSISPFSLPLEPRLFQTTAHAPDQLFGIFRDSLPDDWGRLLMDRAIEAQGVDSSRLTEFSRLALVGEDALGALEYGPCVRLAGGSPSIDLDALSLECQALIDSGQSDEIATLLRLGGSSGGARPKVMVDIDGEPWIVKFPTSLDGMGSGAEEYRFSQAARACGIRMADTRLIPSKTCPGFFATRRFDRVRHEDGTFAKIHMSSAAALLEVSPFDVVDYRDLMRLVIALTHDASDGEQLYRVMCFNVYAANCDDHSRNFSFLYDEADASWHLSPAYDLTRNDGFMGEHTTLVNGKGSGIDLGDLVSVGRAGGLTERRCTSIAREIREAVGELQ